MRKILAVLVAMVLAAMPCRASYTGLLVTSGANLYEITSGGVLTLVDTYTGVSLGALAEGAKTSTTSEIYLLNSAGTDLYKINYSLSNGIHVTTHSHRGALGVTGTGLAYISGTLYTTVYNSSTSIYEIYTVSTSTGAASLLSSSGPATTSCATTDGTNLYFGHTGSNIVAAWTPTPTYVGYDTYTDNGSGVTTTRLAWDGSSLWILDNLTNKLSYGVLSTDGSNHSVTVTATGVYTYNGMCWGYVPW